MKKTIQKKKLQSLIVKWDRILKESGFEDIEDRRSGCLKQKAFREYSLEGRLAKTDYYRFAAQALHAKTFKNDLYRDIWALHSTDSTFPEIAKQLYLSVRQVAYAVSTMQKQFGLKLSQNDNIEATKRTGSDSAKAYQNKILPKKRP